MKEFKNYHPIVNFIYFFAVIGFSMVFMHPVCLGVSLLCSFLFFAVISGMKALGKNLLYLLPMAVFMTIINPMFNHAGVTILAYFPSGNPLTFEALLFGFLASVMIITVISWFASCNKIMTSDKFIYLFGRIIPALSLVFSMTLRFIPRFVKQFKEVLGAQKCVGKDISRGKLTDRAKVLLEVLSVMITWALENSIETADSMKARGYGLKGRTTFSIYRFDRRDIYALAIIVILSLYILAGGISGNISCTFFPSVRMAESSFYQMSIFVAYFMLCIFPVVAEVCEVIRWKVLKSKI